MRIESSDDIEMELYEQVVALDEAEAEKDAHDDVTPSAGSSGNAEDTENENGPANSDHEIGIIYIEKETDDAVTASAGENVRPCGIMHTGSEKETAAPQTSY